MSSADFPFEKTIELLLQQYECVILPGFGGFIVRDSPCNFNADKKQVKPFARHIFFNPHLIQNDGLLINEIQKFNGLSYTDANEFCNKTIDQLKLEIETSGSRIFGELGTFFKGQQNVWFAPSSTLNLSLDSYGLAPVDVRLLHEEALIEEEVIPDIKPQRRLAVMEADKKAIETTDPVKPGIKPWLIAASLALLIHFAYLNLENTNKNSNEASVIPSVILPDTDYSANSVDTGFVSETPVELTVDSVAVNSTAQIAPVEIPVPETSTKSDTVIIHEEIVDHSQDSLLISNTETRVAKYLFESNANYHAKDILRKGQNARVDKKEEWYEVILIQTPEQ